MSNFLKRLVVGFFGIILAIIAIMLGGEILFVGLLLLLVALMAKEYCDMQDGLELASASMSIQSAYFVFVVSLIALDNGHFGGISICVIGILLIVLMSKEVFTRRFYISPSHPLRLSLYVGLLFSFVGAIRMMDGQISLFGHSFDKGAALALAFLSTVWATDSAAYLVGRKLGENARKLYPEISGGKTWGGSIAGFIFACIVASLFAWLLRCLELVFLGPIIGIAGQIGDLVESLLKRHFALKDSSAAIPGHGGFLDRMDSTIFCAVIAYIFFKIIGY